MKKTAIERVSVETSQGLSDNQVKQRQVTGNGNNVKKTVGKSYLAIFTTNLLTFFNLLGIIIFAIMLACGSVENMLFFVIILANTVIGIFLEIRSKRKVEKMSLVSQPTVDVVRNGVHQQIAVGKIVLDDVLCLASGDQLACDCILLEGEVEVNESMLTGESDSVKKKAGDTLFSGSFIVAGNCYARSDKVGSDSYIEQLQSKVKKFVKPNSQLMKNINLIIRIISFIIFPLGVATLFTGGFDLAIGEQLRDAVLAASGSMIGMVPSGMVLLTSIALAVSLLRLSAKKVLVQELYCIEMLARVDTLCLDKTGTITDGTMTVDCVELLEKASEEEIKQIVASLIASTGDSNMTANALSRFTCGSKLLEVSSSIAFSSARKCSLATIGGVGTVALGASEFVLSGSSREQIAELSEKYLKQGKRVLVVAKTQATTLSDDFDMATANFVPLALVVLDDTLRGDASEIIGWFASNNVDVKVISGDNPLSVSVIASRVGVKDSDKYISLDGMSDDEVINCANSYTVFGRVSPEQKALLVQSFKDNGKTVAMTGDGVNDILAMRKAHCSITVASGSDATKSVAHLILQNNNFSAMPSVVAEGRRVVNNIQNSSSLFLMKTTMTVLVTLMFLFMVNVPYPFQPQHLYAIELFVIGISSFLFALKPNHNIIKGNFLSNTMVKTLPSGVAMFLSVAAAVVYCSLASIPLDSMQFTTIAMFSMTATGLVSLWILAYPYNLFNVGIALVGTIGTVACFIGMPWIISLLGGENTMFVAISSQAVVFIVINALVMAGLIVLAKIAISKVNKRRSNEKIN